MVMDDNDGQMIFGDLGGLKLLDICLTGEEKPRKKLTQETCPDRGSNPGPLRDKCACYHLLHSGGLILFRMGRKIYMNFLKIFNLKKNYSTKAMGGSPGELSEELVT